MPRWLLAIFAIVVAIAIGHEVISDANHDEPTFYESLREDQLADKEAGAVILARSRAETTFTHAMQACSDSCLDSAKSAAMETALGVLRDGGCVEWEMSEMDPSRGMAARVAGKSRPDAEAECRMQAFSIADRIAQAGRRQTSN
jgi:hypothetical protein